MHNCSAIFHWTHSNSINGKQKKKKKKITYLRIIVNGIGSWSIDFQFGLAILSDLTNKWYRLSNIVTLSTGQVIHLEESYAICNRMWWICIRFFTNSYQINVQGLPFPRLNTNGFLFLEVWSCRFKIFFVLFFLLVFVLVFFAHF